MQKKLEVLDKGKQKLKIKTEGKIVHRYTKTRTQHTILNSA